MHRPVKIEIHVDFSSLMMWRVKLFLSNENKRGVWLMIDGCRVDTNEWLDNAQKSDKLRAKKPKTIFGDFVVSAPFSYTYHNRSCTLFTCKTEKTLRILFRRAILVAVLRC
jgi:hypothetical protein